MAMLAFWVTLAVEFFRIAMVAFFVILAVAFLDTLEATSEMTLAVALTYTARGAFFDAFLRRPRVEFF